MIHFQTILVLASLVSVTWASPIQETIDSLKVLQKIGAKVSVVPSGQGDKATSYTFTISWKSKVSGDPFGPRLDLLVGDDGKSPEPRLQVRYSQNAKGVFEADFTISRIELGEARMAFRESQQTHYFLDLKCLVDGFPDRNLRDPFHEDPKAEQPGAGQPANMPADKVPAKDQPSTPTSKDGPRKPNFYYKENDTYKQIRFDAVEIDPRYAAIFLRIDDEVDVQLKDKLSYRRFGHVNRAWTEKKKVLQERYGITWRSPSEMNPGSTWD